MERQGQETRSFTINISVMGLFPLDSGSEAEVPCVDVNVKSLLCV